MFYIIPLDDLILFPIDLPVAKMGCIREKHSCTTYPLSNKRRFLHITYGLPDVKKFKFTCLARLEDIRPMLL